MGRLEAVLALCSVLSAASCLSIGDSKDASNAGSGGNVIASGGSWATGGGAGKGGTQATGGTSTGGAAGAALGGTAGIANGGSGGSAVCTKDCGGGACVGGVCQPVQLAADGDGPVAIALDDTYVYWASTTTGVKRVPKAGGTVEQVNDMMPATAVAYASTGLAWIEKTGVNAYDVDLKTPNGFPPLQVKTLASGVSGLNGGLAVEPGGNVYWTTSDSIAIYNVGGPGLSTPINTNTSTYVQVTPTGRVVWLEHPSGPTNPSSIRKNGPNNFAQDVVSSIGFDVQRLAVDATYVYWTNHNGGGVQKCAWETPAGVTDLSSWTGSPMAIAVDASNVWYTDDAAGQILVVPVGGGNASVVADQQTKPQAIALDGAFAYWANNAGGAIMKLAQ